MTRAKLQLSVHLVGGIMLLFALPAARSGFASRGARGGLSQEMSTMAVGPRGRGPTLVVRTGDDLQAVLNSAIPGDTVVLQGGATFVGNFVLPPPPARTGWVTVISDGVSLPETGVRIGPDDATAMPKIVSSNSQPAIKTSPGSQFFQFIGIEFGLAPDVAANDGIILLGDGSTAQKSLDQVPHDFLIDRCYIHGNALSNSKRGIALNCSSAVVQNSYISDIHAVGFDTQAIAGWNGPGPFTISNNYLEASGENIMFGGADPSISGLIPSDIAVQHNLFSKPLGWMNGILGTVPEADVTGAIEPEGALTPGLTYYYRVTGTANIGSDTAVQSPASGETAITLGPGQDAVTLTWPSLTNATGYLVYRTSDPPSADKRSWTTYRVDGPTGAFIDIGASTSEPAASPAAQGTRWSVKNLLELKNSQRVLIEGNIFENNWLDAQTGYAISFKSVDQDGTAPWSSTREVVFTNNVVRNVASAINVQGTDPDHPSGQTCCISIRNNLFYGILGAALGGEGTFLKITDVSGCLIDHNTIIQSGNLISAYGNSTAGFTFSNNIAPGNAFGIKGDGTASGNSTLETYFPAGVLKKNVIVGAATPSYPANNYYPASLSDVGFVDLGNSDLRLSSTSPFLAAGTKGTDVGADVDRISKEVGGLSGPN